MKTVDLPIIKPRWYQTNIYRAFDRGSKRIMYSWPRRHGKDVVSFSIMVSAAIRRPGIYYYYFPTLALAKKALWNNFVEIPEIGSGKLIDLICPHSIRRKTSETESYIELINGAWIQLGGTDNLAVIGQNGFGYVFSEWSLQKKKAFELVSPILRENAGWALFQGTMRGKKNHLYEDMVRNQGRHGWHTQYLVPELTKQYYWEGPSLKINMELKGQKGPDGRYYQNIQDLVDSGEISMGMARREYLNYTDNAVEDAYYAEELSLLEKEGRVCEVNWYAQDVFTAWDVGVDNLLAIVFFIKDGDSLKVIDYHEDTKGRGLIYAMEKVVNTKPYKYGGHFGPHDMRKRQADSGKQLVDIASEQGYQFMVVPKTSSVLADIEAVRRKFSNMQFDPKSRILLQRLEEYHEAPNGKPEHDGSDGPDAFRTMCMADEYGMVKSYLLNNDKVVLDDVYDVEYDVI